MSKLVSIIALSHGVQSCRMGYKPEFIIERCIQAAKLCDTYGAESVDVALRFAELYGAVIVDYISDESMERVVKDSAEKLNLEFHKAFREMLPQSDIVEEVALTTDAEAVVAKITADYEAVIADLKAKIQELLQVPVFTGDMPVVEPEKSEDPQDNVSDVTAPAAESAGNTALDVKKVDLAQVPIAVLSVTKALKTTLLGLGCQTVADVVKRHAEKPLESEAGIGEKSQQMILDAIAKLG